MSLENKINNDIKQAMLAKEKAKLEALRAVKSALLLAKTEKGGNDEMSQANEISILQKLVKQRKEAADIFSKGDRSELAENEIFQANIIQEYLPEQMSDAELESIIKEIMIELNAQSIKDMGKVIGKASQKLAGRAENKLIAEKVKQLLNQ